MAIRGWNQIGMVAAAIALPLTLGACEQLNSDGGGTEKTVGSTMVDGEYLKTGGDGSNWAAIGFSYDEQRYSPLKQINTENVSELGLIFHVDLPDARGQEATPVVVDGIIYISTAWSKVMAVDARNGETLWSFDPEVDKKVAVNACCDVVNRGVAVYQGKVFVGTLDGRLIALDAGTGARLWSKQTTDQSKPYTITGAPRVVKDMVLIGNGGAEFGVRGYISAYDIENGNMKWRFYTVPNPDGEPDGAASDEVMQQAAARTWSDAGEWKESGGGGTVWDAIVYDHELDQLYIGVGNGNPWNHGLRSNGEGDNLFLSSVVALKPDSGEYLWHYQETPAETWDFTATQPIILADLTIEGEERKVLMQAPKNGFFFVIDRTDGSLISANPFIEGINWAEGYDMETGRPIENPAARFYKTGELFVSLPSALGAHNWHPMSYNPEAGLVYIPAQKIASGYLAPLTELDGQRKSLGFNTGGSNEAISMPDDINFMKAAIAATTGQLVAYDPAKGEVAWTVDHQTPWNGGTMTTAGGLVFQGTSLGEMRAYDAKTGEQLWSWDSQSGILGGASTFLVDGEQHIAFLTSKGGAFPLVAGPAGGAANPVPNIPRLIVMKLGGKSTLPDLPPADTPDWSKIPEQFATEPQIAEGRQLYLRYCLVCHGDNAVGGGVLPDLRRSGVLGDKETWQSIVHDGALSQNGMVAFEPVMSKDEIETIRGYVINRAEWGRTVAEAESAEENSAGN
ncbi:PQQ-dependent dehydrogenase, methanol/ethanol family [Alterisphingorhabdus coralli]|uniref:PQQ-dependent dehydrogenase, methanol/ethanol family n=1 Tax=Alterisphingorhabdus coralli TaxID=3071408 RepID=A0AA97F915_9SPHN|nr:PQQ-dependent dehydrogenase, methanol/ethanol family [Parasphingorhabdus sp. SCSIO 66989]WOE76126.1 PQQ-dependent dehydrogenase, methanol/ethanol family [Parasphingorhabdus sp. SCSIO 66989]